jgi:hypothetical protein
MGALRTSLSWAKVTIDANPAEKALIIEIVGSGITQLFGVVQVAAKSYGEPMILGIRTGCRPISRAADREKSFAVGQFDELRNHDARSAKGSMNVPYWAGATVFGEMKGGRVESFGDIASFIDAQKKERHTLGAGPLQGRQPVARLLERHAKA